MPETRGWRQVKRTRIGARSNRSRPPLLLPERPLGAEQHVVRCVPVDEGRVPAQCRACVRGHRKGLIVGFDEGGRVLGEIPAGRGDHRHDLSHVAHRVRGHRMPVGRPVDGRPARCHLRPDGRDGAGELPSGDHRRHPGRTARLARLDGADPRMGPRAPHERDLERAGRNEVVEEAPLSAEKRPVLGGAGFGHGGEVLLCLVAARRTAAAGHRRAHLRCVCDRSWVRTEVEHKAPAMPCGCVFNTDRDRPAPACAPWPAGQSKVVRRCVLPRRVAALRSAPSGRISGQRTRRRGRQT